MVKQLEKKFTWVIEDFSSLKDKKCYSDPFIIGGCKWRVLVFPKGNGVDYLSVYLDVADAESLPPGWRRNAKLCFRIVNQLSRESSNVLECQHEFTASESDWGFTRAVKLTDLCQGFLFNNRVTIETEVEVLGVTGKLDVPVESEKETETVLEKDEHPASEEPANGPQGGRSLSQQEPEFVDTSQKNSDHAVSDGGGEDTTSQWEPVQDSVAKSNNEASAAEKIDPENETVDVNEFQVLSSQAELVRRIFERHPDIAMDFRPKTRQIRSAYMDALLGLVENLCLPLQKLTEDYIIDSENRLTDLTDAGFKMDWWKKKVEEVNVKKTKKQRSEAMILELEEELQKLKQRLSEVEAELQKEKAEVSAAMVPLKFDDVV
ncbi:PREDICTED: MATH domain and coiled-coil domain-containing protein At3g58270-like [Tarenaya hassleriana]|uniref:MATH domain and coiled-coil domain-containing protein At3g58270-like n=1 Tax=Tarenaya hassleriana TaxID=28532 RepID=UPI00053C73E2|nr:PREDICTED: MATH domain and coiled-coil domain-containing protein At3g58270-like [Tarenaya hassleriana]